MKKIIIILGILVVLLILSGFIFEFGIGVSSVLHITAHNPTTGTICACFGLHSTKECVGCTRRCIGFEFGCRKIEDINKGVN